MKKIIKELEEQTSDTIMYIYRRGFEDFALKNFEIEEPETIINVINKRLEEINVVKSEDTNQKFYDCYYSMYDLELKALDMKNLCNIILKELKGLYE